MSTNDGTLTAAQVRQFYEDGYLVVPDFFDPAPLLSHSRDLVSNFSLEGHPLTKFSTGGEEGQSGDEHVGDRYFLSSGTTISYFLEEGALSPSTKQLTCAKERAVNKVGHALHILDPTFRAFSLSDKVRNVAKSLEVHDDPQILQSMIICKQPSIGGAVPSHNDSTFLYTEPPSAVGLWFALEECTKSNGCLSFMPGSHRWPKGAKRGEKGRPNDPLADELGQARGVNKRFVRKEPYAVDSDTAFETLAQDEELTWDDSKARVEECPAGTLVLIHGSVLHKSEKNLSDKSRFIYTFHMIEGNKDKAIYDEKNWLQPTAEMPFTSLFKA